MQRSLRHLLFLCCFVAVPAAAQSGQALRLDGHNDYAWLLGPLPDLPEMTIELWALFQPPDVTTAAVIFMDATSAGANDFVFNMAFDAIGIRADKSGARLSHESSRIPVGRSLSDRWHHIAWVMAADRSTIYINGELAAEVDETGSNVGYHAGRPTLGRWYDERRSRTEYFPGHFDEFRIWSRPLSAEQVQQAMSSAPDSDADLVLWYDFEEPDGDVVDRSGNERGATLEGGARRVGVDALVTLPPIDMVGSIIIVDPDLASLPMVPATSDRRVAPAGPVPALTVEEPEGAVRVDTAGMPPEVWSTPYARGEEEVLEVSLQSVEAALVSRLGIGFWRLRIAAVTANGALYLAGESPTVNGIGTQTLELRVWRSLDGGHSWELLLHRQTQGACDYDFQLRAAALHPDGRVFLGTTNGLFVDGQGVVVPQQATNVAALHVSGDGRYLYLASDDLVTHCEWPTYTYSMRGLYRARIDGDAFEWADLTNRTVLRARLERVGSDPADNGVAYFGGPLGVFRTPVVSAADAGWREIDAADLPSGLAFRSTLPRAEPFLRVQEGYARDWTSRDPDYRYGWRGLLFGWEGFVYAHYRGEFSHNLSEVYIGSRDGGVTWSVAGRRSAWGSTSDFEAQILAADARGLLRITGSSFTRKEFSSIGPWTLDPVDPLTIYVGMRGRGFVYGSVSHGTTWTRLGQGVPPTLTPASIGVDSLGVLYVKVAGRILGRRIAERVARVESVALDTLLRRGDRALVRARIAPWGPGSVVPQGLEVKLLSGEPGVWQPMRDDGVTPDDVAGDGVWAAIFTVDDNRPYGHDGVIVAAQVAGRPLTRASRRRAYQVVTSGAHLVFGDETGNRWRCKDATGGDGISTDHVYDGARSLLVSGELSCAWSGDALHPFGRTLDLWAFSEGGAHSLRIQDVPAAELPELPAGQWTRVTVPAERLHALPFRARYDSAPEAMLLSQIRFASPTPIWIDDVRLTTSIDDRLTAVTEGAAIPQPTGPSLLAAYPNPFNTLTILPVQLPQAAIVRLEIYDVLGQRVRLLVDAKSMSPGLHRLTWDGRNDGGRPLATGVYVSRLRVDGHRERSSRFLLLH